VKKKGLAAVLALRAYGGGRPQEPSVLIQAPTGKWIYPLAKDLEFSGAGPAGSCVISIHSGSARVASSSCPLNICIQTGPISRPGEWIACLPHRVFIRITGAAEAPIDAVAF
jgi:hypothetical protein